MKPFELFTMIFYVLDAAWDKTHDRELGDFLSRANPFLFEDLTSADPEIYMEFCELVEKPIKLENSYTFAKRYIDSLQNKTISEVFAQLSEPAWLGILHEYLSHDHKGKE